MCVCVCVRVCLTECDLETSKMERSGPDLGCWTQCCSALVQEHKAINGVFVHQLMPVKANFNFIIINTNHAILYITFKLVSTSYNHFEK